MKRIKVLLCSTDRKLVLSIHEIFASCGAALFAADNYEEAAVSLGDNNLNLVIVDVDHFDGALDMLETAQASLPTIAMTSGDDLQLLSAMVCRVGVANIVARPVESREGLSELLITADKLLSDNLFGLDKYLRGKDLVMRSSVLRSADDRDSELSHISDFLREHGAPRHLVATITNAADEMLTNAMYNAPVDDAGRPRYAATNRRSKISLRSSEYVYLTYGFRKGVFGISVRDQFGRLRLDHLTKSIRRCVSQKDPIEQKAGGAGLGLYIIARTARQFIINVAPGACSEVIGLWTLDRRKIQQSSSYHSLHYFEQAYVLEVESRVTRHAAGTTGVQSDYDGPMVTIPGLGFVSMHEPVANEQRTTHIASRRSARLRASC